MSQKSFINAKAPPYYMAWGIKKVESSIKMVCHGELQNEMLAKFDAYTQLYSKIYKKGMVTEQLQSALVKKCLFTPHHEQPGEALIQKNGIYETLNRLVELASFYRVMSTASHENGELEQTCHYLIKAGEVHGMIFRLQFELRTARRAGRQAAKEAEVLWGHRYQIVKTNIAKRKSKKANSVKNAEYEQKIEFAKQEWIALSNWHNKSARSTAEKLIKTHGKKVPGKDKLARRISEWKQQFKK